MLGVDRKGDKYYMFCGEYGAIYVESSMSLFVTSFTMRLDPQAGNVKLL